MIQDESVQSLMSKVIKTVNILKFCGQLTTEKGVIHDESYSQSGKLRLKLHKMQHSHSNVCDLNIPLIHDESCL